LYLTLGTLANKRTVRIPVNNGVLLALAYTNFIEKAEYLAFLFENAAKLDYSILLIDLEGKLLPIARQVGEKHGLEFGVFDATGSLGAPVGLKFTRFFLPSIALMLDLDDKCFSKLVKVYRHDGFCDLTGILEKIKCLRKASLDLDVFSKIKYFRDFIEFAAGNFVYVLPYFNDITLRYAYALSLYLLQHIAKKPLVFVMEEPYFFYKTMFIQSLLTEPCNGSLYVHVMPPEMLVNSPFLQKYDYIVSLQDATESVAKFLKLKNINGNAIFQRTNNSWRVTNFKFGKPSFDICFAEIGEVRKLAEAFTERLYPTGLPVKVPLVDTSVLDLSLKTIFFRAVLNLAGVYVLNYLNTRTGFLVSKLYTAFKIFEWGRRRIEANEKSKACNCAQANMAKI